MPSSHSNPYTCIVTVLYTGGSLSNEAVGSPISTAVQSGPLAFFFFFFFVLDFLPRYPPGKLSSGWKVLGPSVTVQQHTHAPVLEKLDLETSRPGHESAFFAQAFYIVRLRSDLRHVHEVFTACQTGYSRVGTSISGLSTAYPRNFFFFFFFFFFLDKNACYIHMYQIGTQYFMRSMYECIGPKMSFLIELTIHPAGVAGIRWERHCLMTSHTNALSLATFACHSHHLFTFTDGLLVEAGHI